MCYIWWVLYMREQQNKKKRKVLVKGATPNGITRVCTRSTSPPNQDTSRIPIFLGCVGYTGAAPVEYNQNVMGDTVTTRGSCVPSDQPSPDPTRSRLNSVIQDIIADHGLDGPDTESAGNFTRNVGRPLRVYS